MQVSYATYTYNSRNSVEPKFLTELARLSCQRFKSKHGGFKRIILKTVTVHGDFTLFFFFLRGVCFFEINLKVDYGHACFRLTAERFTSVSRIVCSRYIRWYFNVNG